MNNFKDEVMKSFKEYMITALPVFATMLVGTAVLISMLSMLFWAFPDKPKVCPECQHVLTEKK